MLFDSHAHYNDERFSEDRDEILSKMCENGVGYIMNACSSVAEIPDIIDIIEKYPFVYGAVGVHPHECADMSEDDIELLKKYSHHPKIKAIGEIGLDYFYDNSPRDKQKYWFGRQIDLAVELNMPIIIHDRDAHRDTLDILNEHRAEKVGGAFHCYTGSVEMLKDVLEMNLYVAFGGSLTFKKAAKPIEAAKAVPLDRLLIETDSPYLTPEPHRGKRNSSLYVHYVAEKLAEIRGMDVKEIIQITTENAKKCFRID